MRVTCKITLGACIALCSLLKVTAQDLAPRAYLITPLHANAVTLTLGLLRRRFELQRSNSRHRRHGQV